MPATALTAEEPWIDYSIFEGLFVRALAVEGPFAEELAAMGFDPHSPKHRYPAKLFSDALALACRRIHPQLPEDKAMRLLGAAFAHGYGKTIVGRVVVLALPFLNLEGILKRFPQQAARTGSVELTVEPEGPGVWQLTYRSPVPIAEFTVGTMQDTFAPIAVVELIRKTPDGCRIRITERKR